MSMPVAESTVAAAEAPQRVPGVLAVYRVEIAKIAAQIPARIVLALCVAAPFALGVVLQIQSAVPADTLFGIWVHASGFALPLVVLGFVSSWAFPVLVSLVAGDIFSAEDRYGTWKSVLTRSCTRRDIFVGKVLAATTWSVVVLVLLALSSLAAGLLVIGSQPLVSLSGTVLRPGHAAVVVLSSWATALLPALGFTGLAILVSVLTRSSVAGVLVPTVVGLVMQLLSLVGGGAVVRTFLLTTPFDAWHGLLAAPAFTRPLAEGAVVSVVYALVSLTLAWMVLRRRDVAGVHARRPTTPRTHAVRAVLVAAVIGLVALGGTVGPSAVTAARLSPSISKTFTGLALYRLRLLGNHLPAGATLYVIPNCRRRGAQNPSAGPGDDWFCTLNVMYPNLSRTPINYEVTVRPNGCYVALGPPAVVGNATMRVGRRSFVNPLFRFEGCFDTSWP